MYVHVTKSFQLCRKIIKQKHPTFSREVSCFAGISNSVGISKNHVLFSVAREINFDPKTETSISLMNPSKFTHEHC